MATLKELIDKHGFDCKYRQSEWDCDRYFIPLAKTSTSFYVGEDPEGTPSFMYIDKSRNWELYQEPKNKKKMWLWIYKDGNIYKLTECYYANGKEVFNAYLCIGKLIGPALWSEIEIDE